MVISTRSRIRQQNFLASVLCFMALYILIEILNNLRLYLFRNGMAVPIAGSMFLSVGADSLLGMTRCLNRKGMADRNSARAIFKYNIF
jgi:hypothetical protein